MSKQMGNSTPHIRNRRARFRFELLETVECGLALRGTEVKSLRDGQGSLEESFARITDGEVWLFGFHIPHYTHGNVHNHEPIRKRKLLLHRREIRKLEPKLTLKGLTLVPIDVHFNARGLAKVTLAVARGKKSADKREALKRKDAKLEMDRAVRRR